MFDAGSRSVVDQAPPAVDDLTRASLHLDVRRGLHLGKAASQRHHSGARHPARLRVRTTGPVVLVRSPLAAAHVRLPRHPAVRAARREPRRGRPVLAAAVERLHVLAHVRARRGAEWAVAPPQPERAGADRGHEERRLRGAAANEEAASQLRGARVCGPPTTFVAVHW